ncbi:MAG: ATP-binding protein, partial [Gammaproteobacteria bacterium]
MGHKRRDVLPEPMVPIFEAQEQLVIASKKAKEFVSNVSLSDRDRHLRIFRFPILDGMGAVSAVGGIAIDVTDAVITQQELNEQRNSLEIAVTERTKELELEKIRAEEANNAKSAFLATMSHEIRTPMNGVMGMVEVLRLSELKPRQQEQVELIRDSAKSLLSVIDDILDFSKIEAGKILLEREPVVLSYLFESSCASLAALARQRRVDFEYYRSLKLPASIVSDSVRLRQIIHNVGGNALKFSSGTPRHGKVAIRFEAPDKESLRIIVRDNGIGMNTEQVDHLFTAFQQADVTTTRRFGGTGLGMAITYRLVQLLNGYITVQSEPDVGTTISITLPIQSVSEHTSPEFTYHGDLKKIHVHTTVAERMENWIEYFQAIEMPVAPIAN